MGSPRAERPSGELDELTLVRAQRGDEAACRELVRLYQRRVFALLSRVCGPSGRADLVEDLAQETFLRAFRALAAFDRAGPARLSTWLLTIASRLALDALKRKTPRLVPLEPLAHTVAGDDASDAAADRRELGDAVQRAVAALAPEFRVTFILREVEGLSYDEIARALDCDLGTVKSRLSRAKAALRQALDEVRHG
jgi:RNA polymerase sigma-70 factor (ECF subfamily)